MRIYTCDMPELRNICDEVDVSNPDEIASVVALKDEMARLMYDTRGCGIAAPQVGLAGRFVVVDCEWDAESGENKSPRMLINPVIVEELGKPEKGAEGCLSVPGVSVVVERPNEVVFGYFDEEGEYHEERADGLLARCVQHERDHLDGITIIDKLSGMKKLRGIAMLDAAKRQGAVPGTQAMYIVK